MKPSINLSRRRAMTEGAFLLASGALLASAKAQATTATAPTNLKYPPGEPGKDYIPVITPNGASAPWKIVDGVKVFHLIAHEFEHEFAPGLTAICWGYDSRTPGPTIEAVEGDHVRIYVTNRLPEPTTVHWHGILLPSGMDGVTGLTQKPIEPGETFMYEFVLNQHGTYMYHPHFDDMTQQALGMMGMFIIHPRNPVSPKVDRDFAIMLSEWRIDPGTRRPDPMEMTDFNVLTMNSRCYPGTVPLIASKGERVRIRFGNLGAMDHHPIHLHGHTFAITEIDGGRTREETYYAANTVLVPTGGTTAIEFVATPGDWTMHCHMTHHMMNQMGHGLPNLTGINTDGLDDKVRAILPGYMTMGHEGMGGMGEMGMKVPPNSLPMRGADGPFSYIDMGGMFTILKVRDTPIADQTDPGWYNHPAGTVATVAAVDALKRDGIDVDRPTPAGNTGKSADASRHDHADASRHDHGTTTRSAVRYVCPMHPEVTSDKPGKCPKCGMTLKEGS